MLFILYLLLRMEEFIIPEVREAVVVAPVIVDTGTGSSVAGSNKYWTCLVCSFGVLGGIFIYYFPLGFDTFEPATFTQFDSMINHVVHTLDAVRDYHYRVSSSNTSLEAVVNVDNLRDISVFTHPSTPRVADSVSRVADSFHTAVRSVGSTTSDFVFEGMNTEEFLAALKEM